MEIDKTTLADLSIFNVDEDLSIFHKLNLCATTNGKQQLFENFSSPLKNIEQISEVQKIVQLFIQNRHQYPTIITNGTIMVVEKFFSATIDEIPANGSFFETLNYKILHSADYSLVKYSGQHCFDFLKGMDAWLNVFSNTECQVALKNCLQQIQKILSNEKFKIIHQYKSSKELSNAQLLQIAHLVRYTFKHNILDLLNVHAQIDAWVGMANAMQKYNLVFPTFVNSTMPTLQATGLYHLLLPTPVDYDITLHNENNFLFLTGANMAGKSTFIKALGSSVFLAHVGMGVPAKSMQLSYFDGLLSNINVVDNLIKGESYFYNEVQRIKATVSKINNGKKWLILIDELFKGTNVQDAMKCSSTVIEGLHKNKNSLFVLSTHLYEIADDLKKHHNITFKYFETSIVNNQLQFSYQLKDGVSNDRLGYLILQKEGVVDMLNASAT